MPNSDFSIVFTDSKFSISQSPFTCRVSTSYLEQPIWELKTILFRDLSKQWFLCNNNQVIQQNNQSITIQFFSNLSDIKITLKAVLIDHKLMISFTSQPADQVEWIGLDIKRTP